MSEFGQFMSVDDINARVVEVCSKPLLERQKKLCTLFKEIYRGHLRTRSVLPAMPSPSPGAGATPEQPERATDGSSNPGGQPME